MRGAVAWGAALLLLSAPGVAGAEGDSQFDFKRVERLYLDDVHAAPGGERVVELYFRALTRFGVPVKGIRPTDLEVWEDTQRVDPTDVIVEPLEMAGRGITAVLGIDASGTMRGEPFKRAKDAALAFLERLQPQDRVAVVSFAEDVRVVADFDLSRTEARAALRALEIDLERSQHTLLYDGAYRAVELIRGSGALPRRSFVILFSDGKDGGSDRSRDQVIEAAEGEGSEPHVLIFSIGYARFGGGGLAEMRRLAESTGGEFLEAVSMVHLRDFFDAIAIQMMNSYLLRFPTSLDGEPHQIRITVEQKSSSRQVIYPYVRGPVWPYLAAAAALLAVALGVFVSGRVRSVGRVSVVSGARAGTVVPLRRGKTTIGALDENDIVLPSDTVSRFHAEITTRGSRVEIADLRSKNGTRVNAQLVDRSALKPGDKILIADVELIYER